MSPEGPEDSPEYSPPTRTSAVAPLPPGSEAAEVVDEIDERIKHSWSELDKNDDTSMRRSDEPKEDEHGETPDEPSS